MYEPIRTKSVHTMAAPSAPHRSRAEEMDLSLAGQLAALLTVTDELRALTPCAELDRAAEQLAESVARLHRGRMPFRPAPAASAGAVESGRIHTLHRRAQSMAGRALVIAESREDEECAALAARRLAAHSAAA